MADTCPKCGSVILENEVCTTCRERLWLSNPFEPVTIFYSYSHKDQDLRDKLEAHLAALRRSGLIREWHDRKITPGQDWDNEISAHLESAQIILLLISADFLSSSYISDIEVRRALQRQRDGAAVVVPVILRPVLWDIVPEFRRLQALPEGALPVTEWSSHDSAFVSVCEGILRVVLSSSSAALRSQRASLIDPDFHGPKPASRRRKRTLDAALPARVPIARPSTLIVMVRRTDAPGLRAIVKADPSLGINDRDIDSQPVMLEFPTDKYGAPQALEVKVKVDSPQFQPRSQVKCIVVPPRGDSKARVFLMTPSQTGPLVLNLEVLRGDETLAGCILRSEGVQSEDELPPRQTVASVSLPVSDDDDGTEESGPKDAHSSEDESSTTSASSKGEFTDFFSGPFSAEQSDVGPKIPSDFASRQRTPGDFTRVFGAEESSAPASGHVAEPAVTPSESAAQDGSSTVLFTAPSTPAAKSPAAFDWEPAKPVDDQTPPPQDPAAPVLRTVVSESPAAESFESPGTFNAPPAAPSPADPANATKVFSRQDAMEAVNEPPVPSGPSQWTIFQRSEEASPDISETPASPEPQSKGGQNAGAAAAAGMAPPPVPAWQPPAAPQVPYSMPQPSVPQAPAMPSPQVPVVPPPPQPAPATPKALSYWPLIIGLNALFILAVLLVLYFVLKH